MSGYITYEVKVYDNGDRFWWLNGQRHRESGPAIEWANGSRLWYLNGQLHREDGPAIECADGDRFWYLNGQSLSKDEHAKQTRRTTDPCEGKIVEIEGRKYTLTAMKE
jgi:hypothetical protein